MFKIKRDFKHDLFTSMLVELVCNKHLRKPLMKKFYEGMYNGMVEKQQGYLATVQQKKYEFLTAMLTCTLKNYDKGYISRQTVKRVIDTLIGGSLIAKSDSIKSREKFREKYGEYPPSFLVLSPTQKCNLKCDGCYAASCANTSAALPYEIVEKIVDESYNSFGDRFMTISGGEPFLYKDGDKTLFDMWKKFSGMFFLVYTNGTCITRDVARKLAKLGNVTLAISVEGYEAETDKRRGRGMHNAILNAFKNLREAGVPFGISVTATRKNVDILLTDEFYDFYFEKEGATHMWQFQLMPIGRARDADKLMLSAEQRVKLYRQWERLLAEKHYLIADFWNSGVLSDGCIAYGRDGGYLYIDWHGNILPCVFVPYYVDNIINLYRKDRKLADALFSDFFRRGREWQRQYGLKNPKKAHNWLMPCSIRDHYRNFRENIFTKDAMPENEDAEYALNSQEYFDTLEKFDQELKAFTEPIWQEEYINE